MPPKAGAIDVAAPPGADENLGPAAELAGRIAGCLFSKGYCVCNLNVKEDTLKEALQNATALEEGSRFRPCPVLLPEALLGEEGSCTICELQGDPEEQVAQDGPGLAAADQALSKVARLLVPLGEDLGIKVESRSFGLLHSFGQRDEDEDPPPMTEFECQKWLQQLVKAPLMALLFLGPAGGKLELQPFKHGEAPAVEVPVEPGTTVILRADSLTHKFTASGKKAMALSCWLNQDTQFGEHHEVLVTSPAIQGLMGWATEKIKEFKLRQEIGEEGMVLDPTFPKEWQKAANRMFHIGPQVAVRGSSCKFPSTYVPQGYWQAMRFGVDWAVQVPMLRWNHENAYDPNEESWKYMKTCCRHGCFFDGSELFDNKFFGISNVESRQMDPMQRHILETSYEAMFQSGLNRKKLMRSLIGCYIGAATSEFNFMPATDSSAGTGGSSSITSNRISFCLGMQGPSYTIDAQGASSLTALGHATMSLRFQHDKYKPNHTALVGGVYMMVVPNTWVLASAQHWLSPAGRSFSFDVSAEGYIKTEGVSNCVLTPSAEIVDGQQVLDDSTFDAYIAATGACSAGTAASLTAPNGPVEKGMVLDCVRQASISTADVDAVECWAEGHNLKDAVEVNVLMGALRSEDPDTPLGLTTSKSNAGHGMEVDGMYQLLKVIHGQKYGLQVPGLHLSELNAHLDVWSGDEPLCFHSENVSNVELSSFVGMTGKSMGGTLTHAITLGFVDTEERRPQRKRVERDTVHFWPAGGGELGEEAEPTSNRPYTIIGSWSEWDYSEPMKRESEGVYGYTVTLGEGRYEEFQILLDGDNERVLHPDRTEDNGGWMNPQASNVSGPHSPEECQHLAWAIDGREELVALIDADAEGKALEDTPGAGAGAGSEVQNPYRQPAPAGTKFRVRLRISGRFRYIEWERLEDEARPS
mmetsp:Transcript_107589/g.335473  ORF Transcript_107589/g.335473 Transcript_107589/m.335473 type:complete len:924 (-) Transcript_107589:120-2891(-)